MSDCIMGHGTMTDRGYLVRKVGGRKGPVLYVHRMVWENEHGLIPPGHHVHHECGNKWCVNLNHLELLTASEHARLHHKPLVICPKCGSDERVLIRTRAPKTYCGACRRQRERAKRAERQMENL